MMAEADPLSPASESIAGGGMKTAMLASVWLAKLRHSTERRRAAHADLKKALHLQQSKPRRLSLPFSIPSAEVSAADLAKENRFTTVVQRPNLSAGEVSLYLQVQRDGLPPATPDTRRRIAVIGAGLAGLTAARELLRAGHEVVLLEAQKRVGGRCHTLGPGCFSPHVVAEAGGMRFPPSHRLLLAYVQQFGLETVPFNNMGQAGGIFHIAGETTRMQNALQDPEHMVNKVQRRWVEAIGRLKASFDQDSDSWVDVVERYNAFSLLDFLNENEWPQDLIRGFATYGLGLGGYGSILNKSFLEILRLFILDEDEGNMTVKGGLQQLSNGFVAAIDAPLSHCLRLGAKVHSVHRDPSSGKWSVSYDNLAASGHVEEVDYVVCTVPLPVLRGVSFSPGLSRDKTHAISNTKYMYSTKVFLQTRTRFWEKSGIDSMAISDLPIRNTYFCPAFEGTDRGLILASYVWEHDSAFFASQTEDDRIRHALKSLSVFLPEVLDEFEVGATVNWSDPEHHVGGAFALYDPGQMKESYFAFRHDHCGSVFFAGEHTSVEHGYFEGAVESGIRATLQVMEAIDPTAHRELFISALEETGSDHTTLLPNETIPDQSEEGLIEDGSSPVAAASEGKSGAFYSAAEKVMRGLRTSLAFRTSAPPSLPIQAKGWDHYTLICEDAKAVSDFHEQALGFQFVKIQKVNTGTALVGEEYDMLNYILRPPGDVNRVLVVTEGLNDQTVFRRYLRKFGPGVHHLAYTVDDVDAAFSALRARGYRTAGNKVMTDVLTGLKQVFIDATYIGVFIELIERPKESRTPAATDSEAPRGGTASQAGFFTQDNMAGLANTMNDYVDKVPGSVPATETDDAPVTSSHPAAATRNVSNVARPVILGPIREVRVRCESPVRGAEFLTTVLGFRFLRVDPEGAHYLTLPEQPSHQLVLAPRAAGELSTHSVGTVFQVRDVSAVDAELANVGWDAAPLSLLQPGTTRSRSLLCNQQATYDVHVADWEGLVDAGRAIFRAGTEIRVHARRSTAQVVRFLANPGNLPCWTCHHTVRQLSDGSWVEVRMDDGGLVEVPLVVARTPTGVSFTWLGGMSMTISASPLEDEVADGPCVISVQLPDPPQISESRRAVLLRLLTAELDILKAVMEGDALKVITSDQWRTLQAYHLSLYAPAGAGAPVNLIPATSVEDSLREDGFQGGVFSSGDLYDAVSSDFALAIHTRPLAVLQPVSTDDVAAAVRFGWRTGVQVGPRGGRHSHSAGGQGQVNGGLVLDMSRINGMEMCPDGTLEVGAGSQWIDVVKFAHEHGVVPCVTTDWLHLSVGGTLSVGGLGFMSHRKGLQAGHVDALTIVTGTGATVRCSKEDEDPQLYDAVRAGLGQFGVMTSVRLGDLQPAPSALKVWKVIYPQQHADLFFADMATLVQESRCHNIHAFLKPCTRACLERVTGDPNLSTASAEFITAVGEGEKNGDVVFYLELADYDDEKSAEQVLTGLRFLGGDVFVSSSNYLDFVTRIPPVVAINKSQGACLPHPSVALISTPSAAREILDLYITSFRRDDALAEVLLMPLAAKAMHNVPMFPVPEGMEELGFFCLFLGTAKPPTQQNVQALVAQQHEFFVRAMSVGGSKRYSYDTVTASVTGDAWREHFGAEQWDAICAAKRRFDPLHVLSPGVNLWQ